MSRSTLAVTLLGVVCAWALWDASGGPGWLMDGPLVVLLPGAAAYGVGVTTRLPRTVPVVVVATGLMTLANQWASDTYHWLDDLVFYTVVVAGPAAAGAAVAVRRRQVRRLARLQAELAEEHRIDVAAARLDEQNRVQQEVHARLAERIGAIALRAEGAESSGDAASLDVIETEARDVLDQLRTALGSLGPAGPEGVDQPREATDPRPRPSLVDALLAVAIAVGLVVESQTSVHARGPLWAGVLGALVVAVPLVLRRSRPIVAVVGSLAAGVLVSAWLTPVPATVTGVALMVLLFYSVGAWSRGWWWIPGWLLAVAGTLAMEWVAGLAGDDDPGDAGWIVLVWTVGALAVGRVTAGWQERVRRTEETLAALEASRGAELRLAVARERQALASELHDTVAHAMTVVCLHAGAPRRTPDETTGALRTIASTAATSLAELRDGLDGIESAEDPLDPSRLQALGRRVGVDLVVRVDGAVTGSAALLGFRVVREALVNVARHAPGATAQVQVSRRDDDLQVEVSDDGREGTPFTAGSGTGLSGLAEAVARTGGRLDWGPRAGGGFRVRASIPAGAA